LVESEATGYGVVISQIKCFKILGESFKNKKVVVSGSGNVAIYAIQKVRRIRWEVMLFRF